MDTLAREPVRFFVAPAWRREDLQYTSLLYPFFGVPPTPNTPLYQAMFEHHQFDTSQYSITDNPAEADIVLLPYPYAVALRDAPELIDQCADEALRQGKKLLIDARSDIEYPIDIPHAIVLRHGGYRFLRRDNEIIMPFLTDDLLELYCGSQLQLRSKGETPVVGFAGWASLTGSQEARAFIKEIPSRLWGMFDSRYKAQQKGVFFRRRILSLLEKSSLIKANFAIRRSYSLHAHTASKDPSVLRKEFVDNLLASDYGLDVRGDANNSIRLFEILSLGRIPIIIDTERNLPFADKIDYRSFALVVDFRNITRLPHSIADFHASLSDSQFADMQCQARAAYLRYFRLDVLTKPLMEEIRAKMALASS